jgi:hypothetical protein
VNHLVPCSGCLRHVRASESSCPFCGVALDHAAVSEPVLPTKRLGRAALFAFGATLAASITGTACGGESESDKGTGGAAGSATGGSGGNAGAGTGGGNTGGDAGLGGYSGAPATLYGLPPPPDSGINTGGGGGAQPLYGAPPDPYPDEE